MIGTFNDVGNVRVDPDVRLQVFHPDISNAPTDECEHRQYMLWRFIMDFNWTLLHAPRVI